ncbi:hypothetical protein, partial [Streptomyces sp. NPDC001250]|uniref:hypothetical protein n=1 Tax=Streptomyces sp. NPDC001250 TaxID=3154382 RepID=UPI003327B681
GTDMFGPDVDLTTGEMTGEHVVPPQKTERRPVRWETPAEMEGNAFALGVSPRDYARPEQGRRRAAGLPVDRTQSTPTAKAAEPTSVEPGCVACGLPVAPELAEPVHLLCDPFSV